MNLYYHKFWPELYCVFSNNLIILVTVNHNTILKVRLFSYLIIAKLCSDQMFRDCKHSFTSLTLTPPPTHPTHRTCTLAGV